MKPVLNLMAEIFTLDLLPGRLNNETGTKL